MNTINELEKILQKIFEDMATAGVIPPGVSLDRISVEPPRDPAMGDLSTNAAMVTAKAAGMKPRDLGTEIARRLAAHDDVASAEVAGPGFVNFRLEPRVWQAAVAAILAAGRGYGGSTLGAGQAVNVEYVSANPTGPMHVGHGRGAVVGDALAALLAKAGYAVTREYYINDAGAQLRALARSVFYRYREVLGVKPNPVPDGFYPGEYLIPVGEKLAKERGEELLALPEVDEVMERPKDWGWGGWTDECATFGCDEMMALIRGDLAALGVEHDIFTSERNLTEAGAIDAVVETLSARDLVYTGTLDPPKGKLPDDWEERPQLLFRATRFGDDTDRPLRKSDGSWTYFASDIAYHLDKFRRGSPTLVDVWGADHKGYVKRMQAAVEAVTEGGGTLNVRLCNLVNLLDGGEPVKMSKRAGSFVTLREVIDEVGRDVVRFIMLTRNNEASLDFDLKKVTEQSKDNPVFYVQYAHARICSVLRNAAQALPGVALDDSSLAGADLSLLRDADELAMIKLLTGWPRVVESAAQSFEPHRVAFYLADLAAAFHGFWNRGNDDGSLRFIVPDDEALTRARVALARSVAVVIASGLGIIGVEPVEEMR